MDDAKKEGDKKSPEEGLAAKKAMKKVILAELEVAFKEAAGMKGKAGVKYGDNLKEDKLPTPIVTKEEYDKAHKKDGHDHDKDHDHDEDGHDHEDDHAKKEGDDKDE